MRRSKLDVLAITRMSMVRRPAPRRPAPCWVQPTVRLSVGVAGLPPPRQAGGMGGSSFSPLTVPGITPRQGACCTEGSAHSPWCPERNSYFTKGKAPELARASHVRRCTIGGLISLVGATD